MVGGSDFPYKHCPYSRTVLSLSPVIESLPLTNTNFTSLALALRRLRHLPRLPSSHLPSQCQPLLRSPEEARALVDLLSPSRQRLNWCDRSEPGAQRFTLGSFHTYFSTSALSFRRPIAFYHVLFPTCFLRNPSFQASEQHSRSCR